MKATSRIRTGMYGVLSLFVVCLLIACIQGWSNAHAGADRIETSSRQLAVLTREI